MATLFDASIFQSFSDIIVFLFVFLVLFVVLKAVPAFKDNLGFAAIIALLIAFVAASLPILRKIIEVYIPLVTLLVIGAFLLIFVMAAFGQDGVKTFAESAGWRTTFLILAAIFFIVSIITGVNSYLKSGTEGADQSFWTNIGLIIVHPQVFGIIVLFLIVGLAVIFLTKSS